MSESTDKTEKLWTGPEDKSGPLRRPKNHGSVQNIHNTKDKEDIVSKSNLSVDAKEWFPPSHNTKHDVPEVPSNSINARLLKIRIDQYRPTDDQNFDNDNYDSDIFDEPQHDLNSVQEFISRITQDPGGYDTAVDIVHKIIEPHLEDIDFLTKLANLIVNEALTSPNFIYNAARLSLYIEEQSGLFKSGLYLLCLKKTEELLYDHNLTLFIAELYAQKHIEQMYGKLLLKCLKNLLEKGNKLDENFSNNVKIVCQVLKLTGGILDFHHSKEVDFIFNQLDHSKHCLTDSLKSLVQCVINLRESNWGNNYSNQNDSKEVRKEIKDVSNQCSSDGVFYGPDGLELSVEERKWLDEMLDDDSDSELNPEMDEEMRIAYRQFVRQNN